MQNAHKLSRLRSEEWLWRCWRDNRKWDTKKGEIVHGWQHYGANTITDRWLGQTTPLRTWNDEWQPSDQITRKRHGLWQSVECNNKQQRGHYGPQPTTNRDRTESRDSSEKCYMLDKATVRRTNVKNAKCQSKNNWSDYGWKRRVHFCERQSSVKPHETEPK